MPILHRNATAPTVADGGTVEMQADDKGNLMVGGGVASGATDSGNPVKVAGKYNSTKPTFTDGQRGDLQIDARGNLNTVIYGAGSASGVDAQVSSSDGQNATATGVLALSRGQSFNGSTWDRQRNNTDITVLASAARTTTTNSSDLTNYNGRGLHVVLDVTNAGTGSITITISGKDALGGLYYTLLTGAAVTTNSTNVYKIFPGATAVANAAANDILPRTWRVTVTHNNANSITYSVSASVIL